MTQSGLSAGIPAGGKPINLAQLQEEIVGNGVTLTHGLGMADDLQIIFTYDGVEPADFAPADVPLVESAIASHVAMREKTDEEYAQEYQAHGTPPERQRDINSIINGLFPRELVPM